MVAYDPSYWMHQLQVITPKDVERHFQEIIDAGIASESEVRATMRRYIRDAGGTIEDLAAKWTEQLKIARAVHEYIEEIHRRLRERGSASAARASEDQSKLRALIDQYPETALRVIAEIQRGQNPTPPQTPPDS